MQLILVLMVLSSVLTDEGRALTINNIQIIKLYPILFKKRKTEIAIQGLAQICNQLGTCYDFTYRLVLRFEISIFEPPVDRNTMLKF
jgi:hypothetical protein